MAQQRSLTKTEWTWLKNRYGNACAMCRIGDTICGGLVKAHLVAKSRGGVLVVPMCPNCHKRYDSGRFTDLELSGLGIDPKDYHKLFMPKGRVKPSEASAKGSSGLGWLL